MRPWCAPIGGLASRIHGTPGPRRLRLADPPAVVRDGSDRGRTRTALYSARPRLPWPFTPQLADHGGLGPGDRHLDDALRRHARLRRHRHRHPLRRAAHPPQSPGRHAGGGGGRLHRGLREGPLARARRRRSHHGPRRGEHALPGHGGPAPPRFGHLRPVARGRFRRHRGGRRHGRPVGRTQHQVTRGRGPRVARHGRGGEQHALHRHAGGRRPGDAVRFRAAGGHGDAVHLSPRRRPRVLPLPHLGFRRTLAARPGPRGRSAPAVADEAPAAWRTRTPAS